MSRLLQILIGFVDNFEKTSIIVLPGAAAIRQELGTTRRVAGPSRKLFSVEWAELVYTFSTEEGGKVSYHAITKPANMSKQDSSLATVSLGLDKRTCVWATPPSVEGPGRVKEAFRRRQVILKWIRVALQKLLASLWRTLARVRTIGCSPRSQNPSDDPSRTQQSSIPHMLSLFRNINKTSNFQNYGTRFKMSPKWSPDAD